MRIGRCSTAAALVLLLVQLASAYYLPGTYPQEFHKGDTLQGGRSSPGSAPSGGKRSTASGGDTPHHPRRR